MEDVETESRTMSMSDGICISGSDCAVTNGVLWGVVSWKIIQGQDRIITSATVVRISLQYALPGLSC